MRVLYSAGGGIGNVVMATPAVAALADVGFEVTLHLDAEAAPAAELLTGWAALRALVTGEPPHSRDFDVAVRSVWSGAKRLHERELSAPRTDLARVHEAEANLVPARRLGYTGPMPPAHVECDTSAVALEPGTYWALAPGCNTDPFWERKRWGGWDALAARLEGLSVFLGARGERRGWMEAERRLCLAGRTSLREAAGWIACARAFVGIDNGLAHVAAALGAPAVVLFGATSETKNRPLGPRVRVLSLELPCRPCQMTPRWNECRNWRCMDIPVEAVAAAAREAARTG